MTARRLASRVAPLQGEAIDSWLEVLAIRMQMSLGAIARHLGLSTESRLLWRNLLSQKQCDTLAAATGVPPDLLCGMTLSAYDGTALRLDPDSKRPDTTFPFGPLTWSRYCPDCLNESRGRWQLAWRLGWSFACLTHSCLLADCCLSCGRQRQLLSYGRAPTPTRCRCGAILTATPTLRFPPDHVIVEAQRLNSSSHPRESSDPRRATDGFQYSKGGSGFGALRKEQAGCSHRSVGVGEPV